MVKGVPANKEGQIGAPDMDKKTIFGFSVWKRVWTVLARREKYEG